MNKSTENPGETIDYFYLKDTLKSQAITLCLYCAAAIGILAYICTKSVGFPDSFDLFLKWLRYDAFLRIGVIAAIAAIVVAIYSVISYLTRKKCYVEFTQTALCGKLPAFPLRTKYIEIPYKDIIGVKRTFTSRTGSFFAIIVITKSGRIFIPHNSDTKIRKIENLIYELKG
ncbi:MAG: hypothetical protein IJB45_07140 [Clostridia bacterium]|nr:hypothetical protein [Clostridia bacterium]